MLTETCEFYLPERGDRYADTEVLGIGISSPRLRCQEVDATSTSIILLLLARTVSLAFRFRRATRDTDANILATLPQC